jgi:hypothetical protein
VPAGAPAPRPAVEAPAASTIPASALGTPPLYFIENRGQLDNRVAFSVLGGAGVYFGPGASRSR